MLEADEPAPEADLGARVLEEAFQGVEPRQDRAERKGGDDHDGRDEGQAEGKA